MKFNDYYFIDSDGVPLPIPFGVPGNPVSMGLHQAADHFGYSEQMLVAIWNRQLQTLEWRRRPTRLRRRIAEWSIRFTITPDGQPVPIRPAIGPRPPTDNETIFDPDGAAAATGWSREALVALHQLQWGEPGLKSVGG